VWKIDDAPYCYVITAAPDGEGAWYQETVRRAPSLAEEIKTDYKGQFTPAFVQRAAESVENCQQPLTLVDLGGKPDEHNKKICAGATHAVLLADDPSQFQEWREFCMAADPQIVAEIQSDYHGDTDSVQRRGRDC